MGLRITLKPDERMIIGGAVITNGKTRTDFVVENKVPILRQKDILSEENADTLARRIYFTIQLMYIDEQNIAAHHKTYWKLVQDFLKAAPGVLKLVDKISEHILSGKYYRALKLARQLIDYEQEVLKHVYESAKCV